MKNQKNKLFHEYFKEWMEVYKVGAIRDITLRKYAITHQRLAELAPSLTMVNLNRKSYQKLLNDYAQTHEKQTTLDFHHQVKGAILDAIDDGIIKNDPTRRAIIKGKPPATKKTKFLNKYELQLLLNQLTLADEISYDWLILLIAKTGIRFAEALGVTPADFDFINHVLSINKTWDYKSSSGGFQPTKNPSSVRKIQLDPKTSEQFQRLTNKLATNKPIFISARIFNSTINSILARYCKKAGVSIISIHGLRHTHASILLFEGVSTASVARRLGHSSMTTTQQTYLHIIQELEIQDNAKIVQHMASM